MNAPSEVENYKQEISSARHIFSSEMSRYKLGFCIADFLSSLAYDSAEQKPKYCLT